MGTVAGSFDIDVEQLARRLADREPLCILDVREGWEVEICALAGAVHVPMASLPARLDDLPRDRPIVVVCHHGARSARVVGFLRHGGFERAINLKGGIDAWAARVDPVMARYD